MDIKEARAIIKRDGPFVFGKAKDGTYYLHGNETAETFKPPWIADGCIAAFRPRVGDDQFVKALEAVLEEISQ